MHRWIARSRFALVALLGSGTLLPFVMPAAQTQNESKSAALDALFAELRRAPDEPTARAIADRIWLHWTQPADPELAGRMRAVLHQRQNADLPAVLATLDGIIADHPDYAEAWNQRATVHFLLGNYEQSLADIDKVLQYEPRHFGALTGRAMIYRNQGKLDRARDEMVSALAIHPFLVERALFPELMRKTIAI